MPFSCSFFGALESCSNSPKTGSKSLSATRMLPFPEGVYTSAHRCKYGPSLPRPQRGLVLPAKSPPKEQPEKVDARPTACVRFLRRRSPAGLRNLFAFVKIRICTSCAQGLSACVRQGSITTLGVLCVLLKHSAPACQSDSFVVFRGRVAITDSNGAKAETTPVPYERNRSCFFCITSFRPPCLLP